MPIRAGGGALGNGVFENEKEKEKEKEKENENDFGGGGAEADGIARKTRSNRQTEYRDSPLAFPPNAGGLKRPGVLYKMVR